MAVLVIIVVIFFVSALVVGVRNGDASDRTATKRSNAQIDNVESNIEDLPEIEEFDLNVRIDKNFDSAVEVESFNDPTVKYRPDLQQQSCTCADWANRKSKPRNHLSRCCRHLLRALSSAHAFIDANEWTQVIADNGYGGHERAWLIHLRTAPPVLVAVAPGKSEWVDVFARTLRKGERIANASGPIQRSGWNVKEDRWSYGKGPIGARELTPVMRQLIF